jgi:hypothetical protein
LLHLSRINVKEGDFVQAADIFEKMSTSPQFQEFLTLPLYEAL